MTEREDFEGTSIHALDLAGALFVEDYREPNIALPDRL